MWLYLMVCLCDFTCTHFSTIFNKLIAMKNHLPYLRKRSFRIHLTLSLFSYLCVKSFFFVIGVNFIDIKAKFVCCHQF
mgnify:CR=1 FL=1